MENVQKLLGDIYAEIRGNLRIKITLKEPKVVRQFTRAVKKNKQYDENGRLVAWTKQREPKKEYIVYLRMSSRGFVCITNRENARYIYPYYSLFSDTEIESIEVVNSKTTEKNWNDVNRKYIINNTHPNMWRGLVKSLQNGEDDSILRENKHGRIKTVSMSAKFPEWVLKRIEECIENKEDFRYSTSGSKRDLSVEIKVLEDGTINAWYSSEYAGCGNGAYYLLINPRTAIFCEYD